MKDAALYFPRYFPKLRSVPADCGRGSIYANHPIFAFKYGVTTNCRQRLSSARFNCADLAVSPGLRLWMASLPRRINVEIHGARLAAVYCDLESIDQFGFASSNAAIKVAEINCGVDGINGEHYGIHLICR